MKLETLKPRVGPATSRVLATIQPGSWRNDQMTTAERGYGGKWQRARLGFLAKHPLCEMCLAENRVKAASVVDHRIPHRGDKALFWDSSNWAAICAHHHSSTKQLIENQERSNG